MKTNYATQSLTDQIQENRKSIKVNHIKMNIMRFVTPVIIILSLLVWWRVLMQYPEISALILDIGAAESWQFLLLAVLSMPVAVIAALPFGFIIKMVFKTYLSIWCDGTIDPSDASGPKRFYTEACRNREMQKEAAATYKHIRSAQKVCFISAFVAGIGVYIYFRCIHNCENGYEPDVSFFIILLYFGILLLFSFLAHGFADSVCIGYKASLDKKTEKIVSQAEEYWLTHDPEEKERREKENEEKRKIEEAEKKRKEQEAMKRAKEIPSYSYSGYSGSISSSGSERTFTQGGPTGCGIGGSYCGCGSGR